MQVACRTVPIRNGVRGTFRTTPYHRERVRNGLKSYVHPDVQVTREPLGSGNQTPTLTSARAPIASISISAAASPSSPLNITLACTCGVVSTFSACASNVGVPAEPRSARESDSTHAHSDNVPHFDDTAVFLVRRVLPLVANSVVPAPRSTLPRRTSPSCTCALHPWRRASVDPTPPSSCPPSRPTPHLSFRSAVYLRTDRSHVSPRPDDGLRAYGDGPRQWGVTGRERGAGERRAEGGGRVGVRRWNEEDSPATRVLHRTGGLQLIEVLARARELAGVVEEPAHALRARLISWFLDTPPAPFGLHRMVLTGKAAGQDVGMWFGPSVTAGALRTLVKAFPTGLGVFVATDGTLYQTEVFAASHSPIAASSESSTASVSSHGSQGRGSSSGHSKGGKDAREEMWRETGAAVAGIRLLLLLLRHRRPFCTTERSSSLITFDFRTSRERADTF
ncbi:hypothetical protein B0H13DRAFT_2312118 [Mycena leptocephala]|nr:hypothetical protein B0H13DRAFT_2312118 [Mycena leptocephala]